MPSTCPYILAKTTQLFTAARISSQSDRFKETLASNKVIQKLAKFKSHVKFFQPNATANLPPRLNIKGFYCAANYICLQVRIRKLFGIYNRTEVKHVGLNEESMVDASEDSYHCDQCDTFNTELKTQNDKREIYFSEFGISEEELSRCIKEIKIVKKSHWLSEQNEHKKEKDWSMLVQQNDLVVWRRPLSANGPYQYKVLGTFFDISSEAFFNSQIDLEYRKSWDKYAITLDVIDKSSKCESEVIHWVTQFPYPLKSRDYVFVRRSKIDPVSKTMILVSRAATHIACPETSDYIRVKDYESKMVIRPHRTFGETGFDYILTYHDDSRLNAPSFCVNMITGSAVPDFVKTLHDAAARIENNWKQKQVSQTTKQA